MEITIKTPDVAAIGITGPVQCGKSIVMHRLKKILQEEFGATVIVSEALQQDFNMSNYSNLDDWQKRMVGKTVWVLAE